MKGLIIKAVLLGTLVTMAAYEVRFLHAAKEEVPVAEQTTPEQAGQPAVDKDKKQLILRKNIFQPARKATPTGRPLSDPGIDPGPQPLKRPFRVIGIIDTGGEVRADLLREDPREIRTVKVGDLIETVEIQYIGSTYLKCLYAGNPVRIDVGESSNDALRRLLGLYVTSAYYLMGTTVLEETAYAQFYFPREGRYARVSEGDMLGEYQVVRIEPGRVFVEDEYGFQIPIEPITPPNP